MSVSPYSPSQRSRGTAAAPARGAAGHLYVIGGGAAGFYGAIQAAERCPALQVTILERTGRLLQKVRISGGGRCNVTHDCMDPVALSTHYPRGERTVRKAFGVYAVPETLEWFARQGVRIVREPDGRMFPDTHNSETIARCLEDAAARAGVEVRLHTGVELLEPLGEPGEPSRGFALTLAGGSERVRADEVLVAVGGQPTGRGLSLLAPTGHELIDPVPSLFSFNSPAAKAAGMLALSGVAVPGAAVTVEGFTGRTTGAVLITHWGVSGPAVLKMSALAARHLHGVGYRARALIHWLGNTTADELVTQMGRYADAQGGRRVLSQNPTGLPTRLYEYLARQAGATPETRWAEWPSVRRRALATLLTAMPLDIEGKTTYKDEFVTAGGVALRSVVPTTMASRPYQGLFFAGECLDVDGVTGGFNFQHAWTSGMLAGRAIAERAQARLEAAGRGPTGLR